MKKIILMPFLLWFIIGYSQADSSSIRINGLIFKGRDCDAMAFLVKNDAERFQTIDSLLKVFYVTPPINTADVTFNNVPGKEWLRMIRKMGQNIMCLHPDYNHWKRVSDEMRLHGSAWLIHKLDLDKVDTDKADDDMKKAGQKYAKRQDDQID